MYICIMIEYDYCRVDFSNILPKLFVEVADPKLPSSKRLFSSRRHSMVNREVLCKFII